MLIKLLQKRFRLLIKNLNFFFSIFSFSLIFLKPRKSFNYKYLNFFSNFLYRDLFFRKKFVLFFDFIYRNYYFNNYYRNIDTSETGFF